MRPSRTVRASLAGLAVGVAVSAVVVVRTEPDGPAVEGDDAVVAFLASWERYRTGTFRVVGESVRTTADGGELVWPTELVQRPPDVLRLGAGAAVGTIGDEVVSCTTETAGAPACESGASSEDYDAEVREELAVLAGYFLAEPSPLYTVTQAHDGCFELRQLVAYPDPPYGERAVFCFDDRTGALTLAELHKERVIDRLEAIQVFEVVTDADFAIG